MEGNSVQGLIAKMRTIFFERSEMFDDTRPWYVDTTDMSWYAGGGRVKANSTGLFVVDGSAKPVFTTLASNVTVNSESLTAGDTMIGDNSISAAKSNILFDQSAGNLKFRSGVTTALTLDPTNGLVIEAGTAFEALSALHFYDGSDRIGSVFGYTNGSSFCATRLEAHSDDAAILPTAYLLSGQEGNGVANVGLYCAKQVGASSFATPRATVFLESDQPNNQAFISLSVESTTGSANLVLDQTGVTLTNGIKAFKIDHPLDTNDKWLVHTAVESDGNKTCYEGSVTLDDTGAAVVQLPSWFSALNGPNSIHLTPHGVAAPNLHVAQDVDAANTFAIAGGVAGQRVDWFIQSARRDAWAAAHPLVVEQDKHVDERGLVAAWREYGRDEKDGLLERREKRRQEREKERQRDDDNVRP